MIRKLLERWYCGPAYWDYRGLMIGLENYKGNDDVIIDLLIDQLDQLYYKKMSWIERRLSESYFRERDRRAVLP